VLSARFRKAPAALRPALFSLINHHAGRFHPADDSFVWISQVSEVQLRRHLLRACRFGRHHYHGEFVVAHAPETILLLKHQARRYPKLFQHPVAASCP
jgi:hypothetical protein